jgi:release factor glutamine methyltransferase
VAGGWLVLEHGDTQGEAVRGLLADAGFTGIETRRDLGGHERCTEGQTGTTLGVRDVSTATRLGSR